MNIEGACYTITWSFHRHTCHIWVMFIWTLLYIMLFCLFLLLVRPSVLNLLTYCDIWPIHIHYYTFSRSRECSEKVILCQCSCNFMQARMINCYLGSRCVMDSQWFCTRMIIQHLFEATCKLESTFIQAWFLDKENISNLFVLSFSFYELKYLICVSSLFMNTTWKDLIGLKQINNIYKLVKCLQLIKFSFLAAVAITGTSWENLIAITTSLSPWSLHQKVQLPFFPITSPNTLIVSPLILLACRLYPFTL